MRSIHCFNGEWDVFLLDIKIQNIEWALLLALLFLSPM